MTSESKLHAACNLIVLSDVHLGSDLVHHARPDAPCRAKASTRRDRELCTFLNWYREHRRDGRPWRLVIAGDFVDFVGMSVAPPPTGLSTAPTEEEQSLGLGSAPDHTVYKLRQVARHHREVFKSLARFVEAGNSLVVLRGNHDVDFHWRPVQDEFLRQLSFHAQIERGSVEFRDWFYYEEGRVYVEHGHQYDTYCAHEHLLVPVQPRDPRRSWRSLSDVMLSHVVRPTRGMIESGHDGASMADYLRFALGLGYGGALDLARRFLRAVSVLLGSWRDHVSERFRAIREQEERRMEELALLMGVHRDRLRALASLQSAPVTRNLAKILSTVLLDRVLLAVLGCFFVAVAAVWSERWQDALFGVGTAVGLSSAVGIVWARARAAIDPSAELREGALRVARIFPAAFVVMGHTHLPEVRSGQKGECTYVNLGAWAEDDVPDGVRPTLPASRTHLVIVERGDRSIAELMVWDSERGPRRFADGCGSGERAAPAAKDPSPVANDTAAV